MTKIEYDWVYTINEAVMVAGDDEVSTVGICLNLSTIFTVDMVLYGT